jgi:hypothetical protein
MTTPSDAPEQKKTFPGPNPCAARDAASAWLRDFSSHGPLDIRSISVSEDGETFVATVTYCDAKIEITPRHFPESRPAAPPPPEPTLAFSWSMA